MIFIEEKGDLFELKDTHLLVHCISKDCAMGSGIALQFRKYYPTMPMDIKEYIFKTNTNKRAIIYGNRVVNLITKERYYHLPEYSNLYQSLKELKIIITKMNISKIAMPRIGCGLDGLDWNRVKNMIKELFNDLNIEIIVRVK